MTATGYILRRNTDWDSILLDYAAGNRPRPDDYQSAGDMFGLSGEWFTLTAGGCKWLGWRNARAGACLSWMVAPEYADHLFPIIAGIVDMQPDTHDDPVFSLIITLSRIGPDRD